MYSTVSLEHKKTLSDFIYVHGFISIFEKKFLRSSVDPETQKCKLLQMYLK